MYIKREDALNEIHRFRGYIDEDMEYRMKSAINKIPSADVAEVKRGEWIIDDPKQLITHCSNCNWINVHYAWSYCPNCGARMDGE